MISTSLVTTSVHPLYFQPSFGQTQTPFFHLSSLLSIMKQLCHSKPVSERDVGLSIELS